MDRSRGACTRRRRRDPRGTDRSAHGAQKRSDEHLCTSPRSSSPHSRYAANSRTTNFGSPPASSLPSDDQRGAHRAFVAVQERLVLVPALDEIEDTARQSRATGGELDPGRGEHIFFEHRRLWRAPARASDRRARATCALRARARAAAQSSSTSKRCGDGLCVGRTWSLRRVAIFTIRSAPPQRTQMSMSSANTRSSSHDHGCRNGSAVFGSAAFAPLILADEPTGNAPPRRDVD